MQQKEEKNSTFQLPPKTKKFEPKNEKYFHDGPN